MRLSEILLETNTILLEQEPRTQREDKISLPDADLQSINTILKQIQKVARLYQQFAQQTNRRPQEDVVRKYQEIVGRFKHLLTQKSIMVHEIGLYLTLISNVFKFSATQRNTKQLPNAATALLDTLDTTLKQLYSSFKSKHDQYYEDQVGQEGSAKIQKQLELLNITLDEYKALNKLAKSQGVNLKDVVLFYTYLFKRKVTTEEIAKLLFAAQVHSGEVERGNEDLIVKNLVGKLNNPETIRKAKLEIMRSITYGLIQEKRNELIVAIKHPGATIAAVEP